MNTIKKVAPAALALTLLFVGDSVLTYKDAHASPPSKNPDTRRVFYLTKDTFTGSQALTACTTGFHMASIWEVKDTAFLRYDSTVGRTTGDSGPGGPPAAAANSSDYTAIGWIRTGASESTCRNWTSSSPADSGSFGLPFVAPTAGLPASFFVIPGVLCDGTSSGTQYNPGVWCVQD